MTRHSVQPRDRIFVKGYGFLSFAENSDKLIGQNISKSLNSKYSQNIPVHAKQSATDVFKTSWKTVIRKRTEATSDIVGNKNRDKVISASKTSPKIIQKQTKKKYLEKNIYHQH